MGATDWWANLLQGPVGALIGALGAFLAAIWLFRRESREARRLALEDRRIDRLVVLIGEIRTLQEEVSRLIAIDNKHQRYYDFMRSPLVMNVYYSIGLASVCLPPDKAQQLVDMAAPLGVNRGPQSDEAETAVFDALTTFGLFLLGFSRTINNELQRLHQE